MRYLKGAHGDVKPHHADAAARVIDHTMAQEGQETSKLVRSKISSKSLGFKRFLGF